MRSILLLLHSLMAIVLSTFTMDLPNSPQKIMPQEIGALIIKAMCTQKASSHIPSFAIVDDKKRLIMNFTSNNWNHLVASTDPEEFKHAAYEFYPCVGCKLTFHNRENNSTTDISIPHNCAPSFSFDGPNEESMILLALKDPTHACLFKADSKPDKKIPSAALPKITIGCQHRITAIALAAQKKFAICSRFKNAPQDWLNWFAYENSGQAIRVLARQRLPTTLQKIAFLTNATLVGLTTQGSLMMYWLDQNNILKQAEQKLAYKVIDFAVDPKVKGIIMLALQQKNITIALADVRRPDSYGRINFTRVSEEERSYAGDHTLYNLILTSSRPCMVRKICETKKLYQALCNPHSALPNPPIE